MNLTLAVAIAVSFLATAAWRGASGASRQDGPATRSVWEGVFSVDQARRGEKVYGERCALCHAADLTGGESAPPLAGPMFGSNWNGLTLGDLAERIRITMPPDAPGTLSRQQLVDVVAFMLRANGLPNGERDLERGPEMLRLVRFETTKPGHD